MDLAPEVVRPTLHRMLLSVCKKISRGHDRERKGKRRNSEQILIAAYDAIGARGQAALKDHIVFRVPADFKFFAGYYDCCGGDDCGDSSDEDFELPGIDFAGGKELMRDIPVFAQEFRGNIQERFRESFSYRPRRNAAECKGRNKNAGIDYDLTFSSRTPSSGRFLPLLQRREA